MRPPFLSDVRLSPRGAGLGDEPPRTSFKNSLGTRVLTLMVSPSGPWRARAKKVNASPLDGVWRGFAHANQQAIFPAQRRQHVLDAIVPCFELEQGVHVGRTHRSVGQCVRIAFSGRKNNSSSAGRCPCTMTYMPLANEFQCVCKCWRHSMDLVTTRSPLASLGSLFTKCTSMRSSAFDSR